MISHPGKKISRITVVRNGLPQIVIPTEAGATATAKWRNLLSLRLAKTPLSVLKTSSKLASKFR
jgi:hypothetical protein